MTTKPNFDQLLTLSSFLTVCPIRAEPPASLLSPVAPSSSFLSGAGLLGSPISAASPSIFESHGPSVTLREILHPRVPPFEDHASLGGDRSARIAQLKAWMQRFPAFLWLNDQPAIQKGLATFERVRKRRRDQPKFSDDVAIFRYWEFSTQAAMFLDFHRRPAPTADERRRAMSAARRLQRLVMATGLFREVGINYQSQQVFTAVLDQIQGLSKMKRRKRSDAYAADRDYVRILVGFAMSIFDDAPPALICELAALRNRSTDKILIAKQVKAAKKDYKPPSM